MDASSCVFSHSTLRRRLHNLKDILVGVLIDFNIIIHFYKHKYNMSCKYTVVCELKKIVMSDTDQSILITSLALLSGPCPTPAVML